MSRRTSMRAVGVAAAMAAAALAVCTAPAHAQRRFFDQMLGDPNEFYVPPGFHGNVPYNGRFTFARIRYRGYAHFTEEGPGWSHDYPRSDVHFMKLMREITSMHPFVEYKDIVGGNIISMEDPQIFRYPVAYLSEPGGWYPNDKEIENLRKYWQKGGFIIIDDFGRNDIYHFQEILQRVNPKMQLVRLDENHPIFDSFYKISLNIIDRTYYGVPVYYGIFQDNDPRKKMLAIVNYNNDIGEYWEWSDEGGFAPIPLTNEAYKLGINYLVYALTH